MAVQLNVDPLLKVRDPFEVCVWSRRGQYRASPDLFQELLSARQAWAGMHMYVHGVSATEYHHAECSTVGYWYRVKACIRGQHYKLIYTVARLY